MFSRFINNFKPAIENLKLNFECPEVMKNEIIVSSLSCISCKNQGASKITLI